MKLSKLLETSTLERWTSHLWVAMSPHYVCVTDIPENITQEQWEQLVQISFDGKVTTSARQHGKRYIHRTDYWHSSAPRKDMTWAQVVDHLSKQLDNKGDFS